MNQFFEDAAMQNHPLRAVQSFLENETKIETSGKYEDMRFVGYVLELGYDTATIITSDSFKMVVGGVPRNSLLIMTPSNYQALPPHFTLLRVLESAPTPLSREVQQTYFELQKKSMPELDVFTQSELQWGALKTTVLGMFYANPDLPNSVEFSGDLNNFVSAHKYRVHSPDESLLNLIVNSIVPNSNQVQIGHLRQTECRLPLPNKKMPVVPVLISTDDFVGARTAMFGKTRLGKSNVVKLIAQSVIETSVVKNNVGQLIFDINGEYANDNPQDGNASLRSAFPDRCTVYALTKKEATPSEPLKLNFYETPESTLPIIAGLLRQDAKAGSNYIDSFVSVELPSIEVVNSLTQENEKCRAIRKIQMFWSILNKAGFDLDAQRLYEISPISSRATKFNPGFSQSLRTTVYNGLNQSIPPTPQNVSSMRHEFESFIRHQRNTNQALTSSSGNPLFDPDDLNLLNFLEPLAGRTGAALLAPYRIYHDKNAGDFLTQIIDLLLSGQTVILDLGNANPQVLDYFSGALCKQVFRKQVDRFSNNDLGDHFIQLYFEEAHNLFPAKDDPTTIYSRFAKEGAKYHIGMVYSTQSPTTISRDLLAQTENFFIAHLSSEDDVNALAKVNIAYRSLKDDILIAKTPGYMRMLTRSHRFAVSVQAKRFTPVSVGSGAQ